jgi:uncharacterized protein Usg
LYRRPDHRWLLQSYIWQAYDLFPVCGSSGRLSAHRQIETDLQIKQPLP